jgi:hypothetical protein
MMITNTNSTNYSLITDYFSFNLSILNILKLSLILFLLLVNIYLIYIQFDKSNRLDNIKYMQSGVEIKHLRNLYAIIAGNVGLYASILTIKDQVMRNNEIQRRVEENKELLEKAKEEIINEKIIVAEIKTKYEASSGRMEELLIGLLSGIKQRNEKSNKIKEIKLTEEEKIIWQKDIDYKDSEILKQVKKMENENTEMKKLLENVDGINISESSIPNPFELFENLDIFSKLALSLLFLNSAIISGLISIVFIFYGDYLINKFQLEIKFPKLAKIIQLRRKFQKYYLILSILLILSGSLSQIIFSLIVLTL